jgi:hypothetical protein
MIEVKRISEGGAFDFEVVVREGEGETRHYVTMSREMCERLTAGKIPRSVVSRRRSDPCSIASQRNRSSDIST